MARHRDAQAEAFREASPDELTTDDEIAAMLASGELVDTTRHPIVTPDEWENRHWDAERSAPKTLDEARSALLARVEDPSAPDTDATVYDGLPDA